MFNSQKRSQVRSQNLQNDHFRGVGQTIIITFRSHTEYFQKREYCNCTIEKKKKKKKFSFWRMFMFCTSQNSKKKTKRISACLSVCLSVCLSARCRSVCTYVTCVLTSHSTWQKFNFFPASHNIYFWNLRYLIQVLKFPRWHPIGKCSIKFGLVEVRTRLFFCTIIVRPV